ncbi:MAG: FtsH protease activity modulator HflK [Synergistaceae bacterium]|jgi:membrane protease subunit HflK|nr:FtsH protease activity modulator HflK [Synergistaceae bacterium]
MAKVIIMPDPDDPGWKGWILRFAAKHFLWLALLAVAALAAAGNVYTIPSDSRGIVLRFGAISGVAGPGLHVKLPFADDIYVIPAERKQSLEFGFRAGDRSIANEKLMLTKDNKLIEVEWVMHFHIGAPEQYVFNLPGKGAEKEKILRDLCMATMRRIFAAVQFDEGLTSGKQKIQDEALRSLQSTFDGLKTGILIDEVLLQETNVSEAIKAEYNSVTTAEEQVKTMIYQAEAHANKVVPEAEGRASVLVNEGEAYKFKRVSEAQGEAARLNLLQEAYKLNPELTRLNMWAEGMTEVWKKLNVVFVEGLSESGGPNGAGTLKVLPLAPEMIYRLGGTNGGTE